MKKNCFKSIPASVIIVLSILANSCTKENEQGFSTRGHYVIASTEVPETKTTLSTNQDGIGTIFWKKNDYINVFYDKNNYRFGVVSGGSQTSRFYIHQEVITSNNVWALYPYYTEATCDKESVSSILPNQQNGEPFSGSVADFPMVAHSNTDMLHFRNVCGGIKITLSRSDIKKITFKGNKGENLAGLYKVKFVNNDPVVTVTSGIAEISIEAETCFASGIPYYLVCFPVTLSGGFTITFETTSETGEYVHTSPVTIKRSCFGRKENIDNYASFHSNSNSKISYVTTDCLPLDFGNKTQFELEEMFDAKIVSNTYDEEENEGVIEFAGKLSTIGEKSFYQATTLRSIVVPEGVEELGRDAFNGCTSLFNVSLPSSLKRIKQRSFAYCSVLKNISLPENITQIGYAAFYNCSNLRSVIIPATVGTINGCTFYNCTQLKSVSFAEPSRLKAIEITDTDPNAGLYYNEHLGAFQKCSSLTNILLPDGLEIIGENAFAYTSLSNIEIPQSVTKIGKSAFLSTKLTSVEIPASVMSLGGYVFQNCKNLERARIKSNITELEGTFYGCSLLSSITIPSSVTQIKQSAFKECGLLQSIVLPDNLELIGDGAFQGTSLESVSLPNGLTYLGGGCFSECPIQSLSIPNSVTYIGESAFSECKQLKSIDIPSSVKTLGSRTFYDCTALTDAAIGCSIIKIWAFSRCSNLRTVKFGKRLSSVSSQAFTNCPSLEKFECSSTSIETTEDGRCLVGYDGTLLVVAQGGLSNYVVPEKTQNYQVEYLGAGVFMNAEFSQIVFPSSIMALGTLSLNSNISDVYFTSLTPPELKWTSNIASSSLGDWMVGDTQSPIQGVTTIHVPESSLNAYKSSWTKVKSNIVPYTELPEFDDNDGVQSYEYSTFYW